LKALSEQDHYEILEIGRGASAQEVERAYRLAQGTWAEDSLAGYSIFEEGDARSLRERVEAAWRVLSSAEARRAYDAALGAGEDAPAPAAASPLREPDSPLESFEDLDEGSGEFDGPRLRRLRLRRGLELEQIAGLTKVNPLYLRFLEEERFADLPAPVYVRGFVALYAATLGLDAVRVARSYMQRYALQHAPGRRGRFFERR
jgi:flagellar biosynthesis protein FlhG